MDHLNKKEIKVVYVDISQEEKDFLDEVLYDLRKGNNPKSYSEIVKKILNDYNIEIESFDIVDAIIRHKNRLIETKKRLPLFDEADEVVKEEIFQEMLQLKRAKARMPREVFVKKIRDLYSVELGRVDLDYLVKRCSEIDICTKIIEMETSLNDIKPNIRTIDFEINGIKESMKFEICNIVFSGSIFAEEESDRILDIPMFLKCNPDAEYNKERFPGITIRIRDISTTILLFGSGNFVAVGLKDTNYIDHIKKKLCERINRTGVEINPDRMDTNICNIVLKFMFPSDEKNLEKKVDLNMLTLSLDYCMYEPEVFPGLIHKPKYEISGTEQQVATFLIFSTKNIICAGVKEMADITEILTKFVLSIREMGDIVYIKEMPKLELDLSDL